MARNFNNDCSRIDDCKHVKRGTDSTNDSGWKGYNFTVDSNSNLIALPYHDEDYYILRFINNCSGCTWINNCDRKNCSIHNELLAIEKERRRLGLEII